MSGESGKAKPVMFDAWIERRQRWPADVVTWEAESVVSAGGLILLILIVLRVLLFVLC